jgi:hypothetical protein
MIPIYKAPGLADGRHQELLAEAEPHRLIAALPAGPGTLQRLALRVAGRTATLLPWASRPSAI